MALQITITLPAESAELMSDLVGKEHMHAFASAAICTALGRELEAFNKKCAEA